MAQRIPDMEERGFEKCNRFMTQKGTRLICMGKKSTLISDVLMCTAVKFWNVEEKTDIEMDADSAVKWVQNGQLKLNWNH